MLRLKDRVAIVTGAGQGIGRAIALRLSGEGAGVAVADLNPDTAAAVTAEIRAAGGRAEAVQVDITSLKQVEEMTRRVVDSFGTVDILVNNAGWDRVEPFLKNTEETWDRVIAINFRGPINCCRAVLPYMIERRYGKIVSIVSDAGRVGSTGEAVYAGAKGGIIAFSKTIAREMARYKINVNCVAPGPTETPLFAAVEAASPGLAESLQKAIPFRRLARPEDIAGAVAFLVSEDAGFITGQTLSVSGGLTMI